MTSRQTKTASSLKIDPHAELPGFNVIRCWKFGSLSTPWRLLGTIRKLKPDVVWFNLVFSSFATPENPFAAFAGLVRPPWSALPAFTRTLLCTTSSNTWTLRPRASGASVFTAWEPTLRRAHCSAPTQFLCCFPAIAKRWLRSIQRIMSCLARTEHLPRHPRRRTSANAAIPINAYSLSATGAPTSGLRR